MQNSDRNKNDNGRKKERYSRYGRAARCLSIMMALVFSVTSLGAALPADATSTVSSAVESVSSDTSASSSSAESAASNAVASSSSESAANSTLSSSATPELTPHVTPTPTERTYDSTVDVKEKNGTLKVTAKADAGVLPEGAVLTVKPITKENTETKSAYQQVENKVKKNAADDSRELTGFLAYDISFIKDNKEIEPDGKVNVTMEWAEAATPATNGNDKDAKVSVLHLEKQEKSDQIKDTKVVNLTENKEKGEDKNNQATVEVKGDDKAVKKAEITVKGFSIFTITWTTTSENATRNIGNVVLHYVDSNGLEHDLQDASTVKSADLSQTNGGIVDLAKTWGNKAITTVAGEDSSNIYTYEYAVIGTRKGMTITGVKVESGATTETKTRGDGNTDTETTTTYKLYYTTDNTVSEDSKWIEYKDSVTKAGAGNADVYLIYKSPKKPITIHFITADGQAITDSDGKAITKTVDAADWSSSDWQNIPGFVRYIDGYTFASSADGHGILVAKSGSLSYTKAGGASDLTYEEKKYGSITGQSFRYLRYTNNTVQAGDGYRPTDSNGGGVYSLTAATVPSGKSNRYWNVTGDFDIYVPCELINTLNMTFHHVDSNGAKLANDTTIPAANNPASSANISSYTGKWEGYSNLYNQSWAKTSINGATYQRTYYDSLNSNTYSQNADGQRNGIFYYYDSTNKQWHSAISRTEPYTTLTNSAEITRDKPHFVTDFYSVYSGRKGTTIHYVDEDGKILKADGGSAIASGSTFTAKTSGDAANISGYTYKEARLGGVTGAVFTTIDYTQTNDNWSSVAKNGDSQVSTDLVNEVWLVFSPSTTSKTQSFDVHYGYFDANNTFQEITSAKTTFTLNSNNVPERLNTTSMEENELSNGRGGLVKTDLTRTDNGKTISLKYLTTRIGNAQGFSATSVHMDTDGTILYQTSTDKNKTSGSRTYTLRQQQNTTNTWAVSDATGRNFILTRDSDGNMSLNDSQHGSLSLNVTSTVSSQLSSRTDENIYTATFHGEAETTTYRVYWDNNVDTGGSYNLCVENFIPDSGNQIYMIYTDSAGVDGGTLRIEDDLKYTGMLKTNTDASIPEHVDPHYEWHRVVTGANTSGTTTRTTTALDPSGSVTDRMDIQSVAGSDGSIIAVKTWINNVDSTQPNQSRSNKAATAIVTLSNGTVITWRRDENTATHDVTYSGSVSNAAVGTVVTPSGGTATKTTADSTRVIIENQNGAMITCGNTTVKITVSDVDGTATVLTSTNGKNTTSAMLAGNQSTITGDVQDIALVDTERHQTGEHWNIAANASERTWLDVEADEGSNIWTADNTVKYYATLSYAPEQEPTTLISNIFTLDYYGQLENGGFENPSTNSKDTDKYQVPTIWSDYSNDAYKEKGIWQTTGTDSNITRKADIEIINVKKNPSEDYKSYYFANEDAFKSHGGNQFAELNAENAGALYQDVITHPNETLSYGLSHRARGNKVPDKNNSKLTSTTPEYDTMYLVIMPTKLAMTGTSNGTELKTQSDLVNYISDHGGFDYNEATGTENRLTYYDKENGILVRKISSSDQAWQTINEVNGYTAKGGLTRFFFVAGPTAYDGSDGFSSEHGNRDAVLHATHGNFLDDVYFSQQLPPPEGININVTKNFRGLTQAQVASMASNASSIDLGSDITAATNPFTFTITNTYTQSGEKHANDALEYADLEFTAIKSGSNTYTFIPTAYQYQHLANNVWIPVTKAEYEEHKNEESKYRKYDIFQEKNGDILKNSYATRTTNGVSLTWTFTEQELASHASDLAFNYTVAESNYNISGMIPTHTYSLNNGAIESGTSGMISLNQGQTGTYNFTNAYSENTGNPSQITVKKTFSGVTRTTVEKLLNGYEETIGGKDYKQDPYSITITKTGADKKTSSGDGATTIIAAADRPSLTLTPMNTGTVTMSNGQTANVTYNLTEDTKTGKVTLTWVIQEIKPDGTTSDAADIWMGGPGTYSVSEKNYTPTPTVEETTDTNDLKDVTVNDHPLTTDEKNKDADKVISLGTIHVGAITDSSMTDYSPAMSGSGTVTDVSKSSTTLTMSEAANLIIVQTNATEGDRYVVWTRDTAGANLRQSVISFINKTSGLGTGDGGVQATLANTSFRSGSNPGTLKYNSSPANAKTTFNYDGTGKSVSFNNSKGNDSIKWTKAYATKYSLTDREDGQYKNNDIETRISNSYEPIVRIKKVSADNSETTLSGATFRLFKYEKDGDSKNKVYLYNKRAADEYQWEKEGSALEGARLATFTTGHDGVISMGKVMTGAVTEGSITYYLEETKAPDGYNRLIKPLAFVVHEDGTVERWSTISGGETIYKGTTEDEENVDNTVAEIDWDSAYYTITISNSAGIVLPSSGGSGTWPYILIGLLMILTAGGWLGFRAGMQRQKESI